MTKNSSVGGGGRGQRPPPLPKPITLSKLYSLKSFNDSNSPPKRFIFRGKISCLNLSRVGTTFNLAPLVEEEQEEVGGTIKIGFKGEWAFNQFRDKLKQDEIIILKSIGGQIIDKQEYKLVLYEQEVSGYFVDQEEQAFNFSNKTTTVGMKDKGVQTLESSAITQFKSKSNKSSKKRSLQAVVGDQDQEESDSISIEKKKKQKKKKEKQSGKETTDWSVLKVSETLSYTPLNQVEQGLVQEGGGKNFALVIVSVEKNPPRSNPDWFLKLKVSDPTLFFKDDGNDGEIPNLELHWYEREEKKIPKFIPRDVLFVRNLAVKKSNGKIVIQRASFRGDSTSSLLLKPFELLDEEIVASFISKPFLDGSNKPTSITLTESELQYSIKLAQYYKDLNFPSSSSSSIPDSNSINPAPPIPSITSSSSSSQGGGVSNQTQQKQQQRPTMTQPSNTSYGFSGQTKKWCEIKDIEDGKFCDVYGEILKVYIPPDPEKAISMFITDYTSNSELMNYSSDSTSVLESKFPIGQKTLQIGIFGNLQFTPFSESKSKLSTEGLIGNFVLFKNLRPKLSKENGLLECTLVNDQKYPDKIYGSLIKKGKPNDWKPQPIVDLLELDSYLSLLPLFSSKTV
ncbi:hypothetical protein JCM3765_004740 [Sporobolomyces pararoseus]